MMDDNGISIKSSHISFQAITDTDATIRRMKFLNISHAIVPSVPEKFNKDFASNFDKEKECSIYDIGNVNLEQSRNIVFYVEENIMGEKPSEIKYSYSYKNKIQY